MPRRLPPLVLMFALLAAALRADTARTPPQAPPAQSQEMVAGPSINLDGESPANEKLNKKGAPKGAAKKKPMPAAQQAGQPAKQVASAPAK